MGLAERKAIMNFYGVSCEKIRTLSGTANKVKDLRNLFGNKIVKAIIIIIIIIIKVII